MKHVFCPDEKPQFPVVGRAGRNNLGGEQTRRLERNGMSAALEKNHLPVGKVVSWLEAGSESSCGPGEGR